MEFKIYKQKSIIDEHLTAVAENLITITNSIKVIERCSELSDDDLKNLESSFRSRREDLLIELERITVVERVIKDCRFELMKKNSPSVALVMKNLTTKGVQKR